jgi:hypothetical protein
MEIDHTTPHARGGISGIGNYGPMSRRHHRIKTHGRWQVQQPFPGIYVWRDPHGAYYLVDHTGTRRITRLPADTEQTETPRPHVVLDLSWTPDDMEITLDYPDVA